MSTATENALDRLRPSASPARIGQATAVEQSRAIAEVQAQVIVAQQMPRDVDRACREMLRSCARKGVAEKAFYRFPRDGQQVSGESVVLAKELARCWGNIDYGIAELRRDDVAGESEMMAFAWDLETNTRPRTTFIVPHIRDTKKGARRLTEVRDIYENNSNMGARRMREMILNVLPPWFIEDAKAACYDTLARDDSDGATVAERAAKAVERFGRIGVRPEQIAQKLGAPQAAWSPADLAQLGVIFRSIERGETTAEDEFGTAPARITPADITGHPKNAASGDAPPPKPPPEAASNPDAPVSTAQHTRIIGHGHRLGWGDSPDEREGMVSAVNRYLRLQPPVKLDKLTSGQADEVTAEMAKFADGDAQGFLDLINDGVMPDGQ